MYKRIIHFFIIIALTMAINACSSNNENKRPSSAIIDQMVSVYDKKGEIVVKVNKEEAPYIIYLRGFGLYGDSFDGEETQVDYLRDPLDLYDFVFVQDQVQVNPGNENEIYPLVKLEQIHSVTRDDMFGKGFIDNQFIERSPYDFSKLCFQTSDYQRYYLEVIPGFHFYKCDDYKFTDTGVDLFVNIDLCNLFWYKYIKKIDSEKFKLHIHKDYNSVVWRVVNKPEDFDQIWQKSIAKEKEIQAAMLSLTRKQDKVIIDCLTEAYKSKLYDDYHWKSRHCSKDMLDFMNEQNLSLRDVFFAVEHGEATLPTLTKITKTEGLERTYQAELNLQNVKTKRIVEFDIDLSNRGEIFIKDYRKIVDLENERLDLKANQEKEEALRKRQQQREQMQRERASSARKVTCPYCNGWGYRQFRKGQHFLNMSCPYCIGSGVITMTPSTCSRCLGRGVVATGINAADNWEQQLCPACYGSGKR